MKKDSRIYIAGHTGLVGKNLVKELKSRGYTNLITPSRLEYNLLSQDETFDLFDENNPEYMFICAAKVGGIQANINSPYNFLYENLVIQNNLIHMALMFRLNKIVNLGSSCIYPKDYTQPLKEEYLLNAPLEPTNEGYALAKICGLKLCEYANRQSDANFISLMPCNLYGPGDHYDLKNSHVLSALIMKIVEAKESNTPTVEIWGTGTQRREFLYINDLIDGMIWAMDTLDKTDTFINIGYGTDISILELANLIARIVDYKGEFVCDTSKPDGMKQKLLDVTKINNLGWTAPTSLEEGVKKSVEDYYNFRKSIKK